MAFANLQNEKSKKEKRKGVTAHRYGRRKFIVDKVYSRVRADTSGRVRVALTLSHVGEGEEKGEGDRVRQPRGRRCKRNQSGWITRGRAAAGRMLEKCRVGAEYANHAREQVGVEGCWESLVGRSALYVKSAPEPFVSGSETEHLYIRVLVFLIFSS